MKYTKEKRLEIGRRICDGEIGLIKESAVENTPRGSK